MWKKTFVILFVFCAIFGYIDAGPKRRRKTSGNRIVKRYESEENYERPTNEGKCGYDSCPKALPHMLNVHLVAHTHDDVGWLKTVDQYYYGSKSLVQKAGVQYILDSVVQELLNDPKKKFIYVESAFFFKWWKEQTSELQDKVKILINEGRLEFIGGSWSMNDEATTHYQSIIDQFTWGLRLLNDTFGECARPRVGWQIDPFGHSREMASLFAQMGFDGLFFGRLDYEDKRHRLDTKTMEMLWYNTNNLESNELFTGALYNNYGPPPGFCFDILCSDEPIIDDPYSPDNNVKSKVNKFFEYVVEMSKSYRTNNVVLTMGEDFNYQDANMWYKNLDKLIKYSNERQANGSNINVFYSTPSCYLRALYDAEITWPTKCDDFFPYSSDPHAFWTGYFTSRPTIKRMERIGNHFLQVCKQLTALAPGKEDHFGPHLNILREAMGVLQHHDAVTGTEKQNVADDYARLLSRAMSACESNTHIVLNQLVNPKQAKKNPKLLKHGDSVDDSAFAFESCHYLNISSCDISEKSQQFMVTLYNPLAHSGYQYVRLPVTGEKYLVKDYKGIEVMSQLVPIPYSVKMLHFRRSNAAAELVFLANELPPLGYKSYFVTRISESVDDFTNNPIVVQLDEPLYEEKSDEVIIGNKYLNISFDTNGLLASITANGVSSRLRQNFIYYEGAAGNNKEYIKRSSGAYIFRPNGTENFVTEQVKLRVVKGELVEEVHQIFNEWISQVIRVYADENHVEFEWMVGPISIEDKIGKEVVSKFYSIIPSDGVFYTDSNGREMIKRVRNQRDTWDLHLQEIIAGNYYPVTAKIALEDENIRMAVLNDRAQGGSSLQDGVLELMVHRRLLHDDAFGVDEALNEQSYGRGLVARGKHYLVFGAKKLQNPTLEARERFLQMQTLLPNWIFLSDANSYKFEEWQKNFNHIFTGLSLSLPLNVNLLTFEPWKDGSILVRFEHILDKDEDPMYSKPVKFNLEDVFRIFDISDIRETTLAGNQWKEDSKRFKFKPDPDYTNYKLNNLLPQLNNSQVVISQDNVESKETSSDYKIDFDIILHPMQIRTFVMQLEYKP